MILMKDIIREGHPALTKIAKDVRLPLSDSDKKTLIDMLEFIKNSQDEQMAETHQLRPAVGIAAPQINISKRMFAIHVTDLDGKLYSMAVINPVIKYKAPQLIYLPGGEGCLSVDRDTEGLTPRYEYIEFEALTYDDVNDQLNPVKMRLDGYVGIVFQHEFDHINGVMYTTKLFLDLPHAKPAFEFDVQAPETTP